MRAWRQVLDRHDGSFLVLYRAYESIDELIIRVKYNGKDVAESPYVLRGNRPLSIDLSQNDRMTSNVDLRCYMKLDWLWKNAKLIIFNVT